ncbi:MAG: hypothetical protein P8R31_03240 [Mariniblastus sp.]|nr:hypothetical protein [Mariniblastus sp.]
MTNQLEHDYQALTNNAGYSHLANHGLIRLTGEDRLSFFHNFCTNEIKKLETSEACEAFILNSKGKILKFVHAINLQDELFLFGHGINVQPTVDHLDKYLIREEVTLEDATANWAGLFVRGNTADECLTQLAGALPAENKVQRVEFENHEIFVANLEIAGLGYLILVQAPYLSEIEDALRKVGISECSDDALQVCRIENATPWHEMDISENNLPQELQRDSKAINFNKGCYLGQETVARIDARGRVNRLLVSLQFPELPPTAKPPTTGDELTLNGEPAGTISSVTFSLRDQRYLGMGFVKRAFKDPETQLDHGIVVH